MWVQDVEFFTFLGTLFIFLTALVSLCWRGLTWRTWGTGVAAAAIWLANWYAPVPTWFGMLLALLAMGALFVTHRAERAFAKTCLQPIQPRHRKTTMTSPATRSDPKITLLCRASHAGR